MPLLPSCGEIPADPSSQGGVEPLSYELNASETTLLLNVRDHHKYWP